jgi:hypothetical protein
MSALDLTLYLCDLSMWERVLRSWIQTVPSRAAACSLTLDPHPPLSIPPCSTVQTWAEAAEQVKHRRGRK